MSNTEQALDLEQRKFWWLLNDLSKDENERVRKIKAEAAARGSYLGGGTIIAIAGARTEKIGRLVEGAIDIRKGLACSFPELGTEASIDRLFTKISNIITNAFSDIDAFVPPMSPEVARAVKDRYSHQALVLRDEARNQFEILKRETALNLHTKTQAAATVSVNTGGGHSIVNLGTIYGDVQQSIGDVSNAGDAELAKVLQELASAINAADELAAERAECLEQVKFIAEQAMAPRTSQQVGIVKGILLGLRAQLQNAAKVAQIVSVLGPIAAHRFGFKWPA